MRCQDHQDLDRYTDETERMGAQHGMDHPLAKKAHNRVRAVLGKMKQQGHSLNYFCPDEAETK